MTVPAGADDPGPAGVLFDPVGDLLAEAAAGDADAIIGLNKRFVERVLDGLELDARLLEWMAKNVEATLAGTDAHKLFPKDGQPKADKEFDERFPVAVAVERRKPGESEAAAVDRVAATMGIPAGTVKRWHSEYRGPAKQRVGYLKTRNRKP